MSRAPQPLGTYHALVDHQEHCAALETEIERFAEVYALAPPALAVPSCPGWSVDDVALHLGTVQRWAERLVRLLAPRRIPSDAMNLDLGPVSASWLRQGGNQLLSTLRAGDPDAPMWAWGADQHLRFWSRRQLHETLVHRMDIELASGVSPHVEATIASDALDEFLVNLPPAARFSPLVRDIRGHGEVLEVKANDVAATWTLRLVPDGFELLDGPVTGDSLVSGTALDLLLVFYRRRSLATSSITCDGDLDLIEFWLEHTALE